MTKPNTYRAMRDIDQQLTRAIQNGESQSRIDGLRHWLDQAREALAEEEAKYRQAEPPQEEDQFHAH